MIRALIGAIVVSLCVAPGAAAVGAAPPLTVAKFSPDGAQVVIGSQAGVAVYAWPSLKEEKRLATELSFVHDLAFSSDGKQLAIVGGEPSEAGGFQIFDWPTGRAGPLRSVLPDVSYRVAWRSGDAQIAIAGAQGQLLLANVDGEVVRRFAGHSRDVLGVCFDRDDKLLLSGSADQSVRVWNLETGELVRTLSNHTGEVRDLALAPTRDGLPLLVSCAADKTVRFWQPTIGRMVRFARLPSAPLALDWSPDGRQVIVASVDGSVHVVDAASAKLVRRFSAIDGWAYDVAVRGNAAVVVGEAGQRLRVTFD